MFTKRKQICADCHFFSKRYPTAEGGLLLDISPDEREKSRQGDFSWKEDKYSLECNYSVWDEGYDFQSSQLKEVISETNRRNFCFFWKHHPGMLFPAARTLQEREAEESKRSRERKLTIVGLWIAAIALLANMFLKVFEARKLWPFH